MHDQKVIEALAIHKCHIGNTASIGPLRKPLAVNRRNRGRELKRRRTLPINLAQLACSVHSAALTITARWSIDSRRRNGSERCRLDNRYRLSLSLHVCIRLRGRGGGRSLPCIYTRTPACIQCENSRAGCEWRRSDGGLISRPGE